MHEEGILVVEDFRRWAIYKLLNHFGSWTRWAVREARSNQLAGDIPVLWVGNTVNKASI